MNAGDKTSPRHSELSGGVDKAPTITVLPSNHEHFHRKVLMPETTSVPLCVDLDGTLVLTDMLHESILHWIRISPLALPKMPFLLFSGKARFKHHAATNHDFDPANLPYNEEFLAWLRAQHALGRKLVLCTAADKRIAESIAAHLDIFEEVLASDGTTNLGGQIKARTLVERFGEKGFDYAGNAEPDLHVWRKARRAITVNASRRLQRRVRSIATTEQNLSEPTPRLDAWFKALRPHQWLKNLLIFIPILAAHRLDEPGLIPTLLLAFAAFCLCASSVYICNDLLDLESDRRHPRKKRRAFAAGTLPLWQGALLAPALLGAGLYLALLVDGTLWQWLTGYFVLTTLYSFGLKRLVLIDCLTLAMLYTTRILAGAAAIQMDMSFWLLAFSIFLFLSLAFIKRYAELQVHQQAGKDKAHGRGYVTDDSPLVQTMGVVAGYAAVVVFALYLRSDDVVRLYSRPEWVWGAVLAVLYWVSWMWLCAHRGKMHDDPLVFAIKDGPSLLAGACFAAFLAVGTI
jgi:4-hydroxybenzoate polyprenyltransferase